jgi:hypothetical protein
MTTPYWVIIHPSGTLIAVDVKPTYQVMHKAVEGWLEMVPVGRGVEPFTAYCNEEGKFEGLPANPLATSFCRVTHDVLVGNILIIGPPDREADDTHMSDETWQRLLREMAERA